jgi:polyvinyl alcohol dehydrogenase (cytochrome)
MTSLDRFRITRRAALQGALGLTAFPAIAAAQNATPIASPIAIPVPLPDASVEWFSYGHDLTGARATADGLISSANVGSLAPIWSFPVRGPISSTPVIVDGIAYAGSYDGNLYAINISDGTAIWTYASGADVTEPNLKIPLGITGSAHVADGVVFVGDSAAVLHAVDIATGTANWTLQIDDQPNASIWSSPVVWNGMVYVGAASIAKETGFRGGLVAVDISTGQTAWHSFVVPEGADGAGVFSVPAIDTNRGAVYIGTQNAYDSSPAPYGDPISIVAFDAATGDKLWSFNAPPNDGKNSPVDDVGFSASPNLFTATIDGQARDLIGQGQKSGDFWVLDRETGEQVWTVNLSPAGFLGGMEGTSAVASGVIVVPATNWPDFDGPATGSVIGLDAATGKTLWTAEQTAPVPAPVAISNDLVFHAGLDGILHAYSLTAGTELWSSDMNAAASGGAAIGGGVVVVGAATPQFAEFIKVGSSIMGFGLTRNATPVASPVVTEATPVS